MIRQWITRIVQNALSDVIQGELERTDKAKKSETKYLDSVKLTNKLVDKCSRWETLCLILLNKDPRMHTGHIEDYEKIIKPMEEKEYRHRKLLERIRALCKDSKCFVCEAGGPQEEQQRQMAAIWICKECEKLNKIVPRGAEEKK